MNTEQGNMPQIPDELVRRVVEKRYLFSSVVREVVSTGKGPSSDMRAVRDALLFYSDQMIQNEEAARFQQQLVHVENIGPDTPDIC